MGTLILNFYLKLKYLSLAGLRVKSNVNGLALAFIRKHLIRLERVGWVKRLLILPICQ